MSLATYERFELSLGKKWTKEEFRKGILDFEEELKKVDGALVGHEMDDSMCPVKHTFVEGAYIREMFIPKGVIITSKIHKTVHPYFLMRGDISIATEDGIVRLVAPHSGVSKFGSKRIAFTHADTVWITVHVTQHTDLNKIEEEVIAPTFEDLPKMLESDNTRRILCHGE